MNDKLEEQSNKLEDQANKLEDQNNKITNQNNTIEELQKKVLVMNDKLEEQNNKLEEQNNKLEEQSNKISNQGKRIEELQKKVLVYSGKGKSCKDIKDVIPSSVSGIYKLEIDGEKLEVRCEMNIASGGWTVLHNRYDGSVNFNRSWTSYEDGFGDLNGEFWLGLKNLNKLTKNSVNDLRIVMSSFNGRKKYAEYKEFKVGDSSQNYKLLYKKGSYTGDAGDSLIESNGREFSTFDKDNDAWSRNCAADYHGGGANWWNRCGDNNINGRYGGNGGIGNCAEFMCWWHFGNNKMA